MSEYKYDKDLFSSDYVKTIDKLIEKKIDKEIFDAITKLDTDNTPVFNSNMLLEILIAIKNKLSTDQIKFFLKTKDGRPIYNQGQMETIRAGFREGFPIGDINIYAQLNEDGYPIYDFRQMQEIFYALSDDMCLEHIEFFTKLNENEEPIYDCEQMKEIRRGFMANIPIEYVSIYAQLKDEEPLFNDEQMCCIRAYIRDNYEDSDKMSQIKECIDKGLSYKQLKSLLESASTEQMRILSSFFQFGCSPNIIEHIINEKISYEELKEIKYLIRCAEQIETDVNSILAIPKISIDKARDNAASAICTSRGILDMNSFNIINRCLKYKMPPEQIDFIANKEFSFSADEMKTVAAGFLNGLNLKEMKHSAQVLFANGREIRLLNKEIESIIMSKFNIDTYLNENVKLPSEYFNEDIEVERGE